MPRLHEKKIKTNRLAGGEQADGCLAVCIDWEQIEDEARAFFYFFRLTGGIGG
jgi:hypothetical protein